MLTLLAALALGACGYDPAERPGTWLPQGINEANLAAMVVNPADLYGAPSPALSRGTAAQDAVNRLLHNRVRQPVSLTTSALGGGAAGGTANAGE